MIDADFLEILACPSCHADLKADGEELACTNVAECGLIYRIDDGIPILLVEEARKPDGGSSGS